MIKGCQKKVIWMRNTESELFDEAYFILSEYACKKESKESDIVKEATRIIDSSPVSSYWEKEDIPVKKTKRAVLNAVNTVFFAIGCLLGASISVIFFLLRFSATLITILIQVGAEVNEAPDRSIDLSSTKRITNQRSSAS